MPFGFKNTSHVPTCLEYTPISIPMEFILDLSGLSNCLFKILEDLVYHMIIIFSVLKETGIKIKLPSVNFS